MPARLSESKARRAAVGGDAMTPAEVDAVHVNAQEYRTISDLREASVAVVKATVGRGARVRPVPHPG